MSTLTHSTEQCPACRSTGPHTRVLVGGPRNHASVTECPDCGERWQ